VAVDRLDRGGAHREHRAAVLVDGHDGGGERPRAAHDLDVEHRRTGLPGSQERRGDRPHGPSRGHFLGGADGDGGLVAAVDAAQR
jgi:hypothetical protein